MTKVVVGLGVAIMFAAVWLALFPDQLIASWDWDSRQGIYLAGSIRIVTGLLLVMGASGSRYPKGLKIFGGLVFIAGVTILFLPLEVWSPLIQWFFVENPVFVRVGGGVGGLLLGSFLVHAGLPETDPPDDAAAL